jgi:hypothetical protein
MEQTDEQPEVKAPPRRRTAGPTLAFLTVIAGIITVSSFIAAFPHGIALSEPTDIVYEGAAVNFYGGIEGEGVGLLAGRDGRLIFASNGTERSFETLSVEGTLSLSCPNAFLLDGRLAAGRMRLSCRNCTVLCDGHPLDRTVEGTVTGTVTGTITGRYRLHEGADENRTVPFLDVDFSRIFPVRFDEVFFMKNGTLLLDGTQQAFSNYVFFRGMGVYENGRLVSESHLVVVDGTFYDTEPSVWIFPVKIVILWAVAVGLFVASLVVKKEWLLGKDRHLWGFSLAVTFIFFVVSFYLWNAELDRMFGLNLFAVREFSTSTILFISLAVVPYLVALAAIGFPASVGVSSVGSMVGLETLGRGIGWSAGFVMTTVWGISLMSALLNMTLSSLLRLL